MDGLKNELDKKSRDMDGLKNELDKKSRDMHGLKNELDKKSQDMEAMQEELHRQSSEAAKLTQTATEFKAEFDHVYGDLTGCIKDVVEPLMREQEEHREATKNLIKERDDVKEQLKCTKQNDAALKAAYEKLQKKLQKLKDKIKKLTEECDSLKRTVRELKAERPNRVEDVVESTITPSRLVADAALASRYAPEVRSLH